MRTFLAIRRLPLLILGLVCLVGLLGQTSDLNAQTPPQSYTVRAGDSLASIAARFGVTVDALLAQNGLEATAAIYVGQVLQIPSVASPTPTAVITTICIHTHEVQAGESLLGIAQAYGVATTRIAQANGIADVNAIQAGQTLCIPGTAATPVAAATPVPPTPTSTPTPVAALPTPASPTREDTAADPLITPAPTPLASVSGTYRDNRTHFSIPLEWFPSVITVTTDTVYQLAWEEDRVAATFTTSHEPVVVGGRTHVIASFLSGLFGILTTGSAYESAGPELLFTVPEGYRPLTPVTLQVETRPLQADGSAVPDVQPLRLDVRLDPQGAVYYLSSSQAGQVAQQWGVPWGFTVTGSWPAAEAALTGDYQDLAAHLEGRYLLRRQGTIVTAEFSSTRSPLTADGDPQAVLFTVPPAYRPATTVTRAVTGTLVNAEGQPLDPPNDSLPVRVQIRPDGTVRYAPATDADPTAFGAYTLHTTWSTNVIIGDRLALALALDVLGTEILPGYVWESLEHPLIQIQGVTTNADGRITHLDLKESSVNWDALSVVLGELTALEELIIAPDDYYYGEGRGPFGRLPPEVGNLSALTTLQVTTDALTGPIPPELGQLANLEVLQLASPYLEGKIPPVLGQLTNLRQLDLSNSGLSGPIPPELGQLAQLEYLDLSRAGLTGALPPELGQLTNLRHLDLSGNALSGPIPAALGQLTNLEELHFLHNNLTGPLPPELGQLAALETLWFESLQNLGPIPPAWGQLRHLRKLIIKDSGLSGALPAELGQLAHLQHLDLTENQLRGPLPATLGQLQNLLHLDLSYNQLDGRLPPAWGQMSRLELLMLKNNQLSGPIPPELGLLTELGGINLAYNNLDGPIPPELAQLESLVWLYLSHNQLWGPLPSHPFPTYFRSLAELDLSHNQLWGPIPWTLGEVWLGYLDLSHNQLEGDLPEGFANRQDVRWVDLRENQLTGCLPVAWRELHARGQVNADLPLCGA